MRSPSSLSIGIADTVDPTDMVAGSGASASLLQAMEDVVARAVPLSGELPPLLGRAAHLSSVASRLRPHDLGDLRGAARRAHPAAAIARPTIAARTALMRGYVARAGGLDLIVQRGCDMELPRDCNVVTFEDSTMLQARAAYPWEHLRGMTERDVKRYVERTRRIYRSALACCCATHWVAESIVGSYAIPAERVFTVGLGQNHTAPEPAERTWAEPRFLFVGVDWERKNGDAVLAAFATLLERHPQARLDVVGGHPPIDRPGVVTHGRLSLIGPADREHLAQLYREATAFVMPSLHEPAGIVYVEAAGAGVPSIGTTDGGAATMIGPGGILVDPREPAQLAEAMEALADGERARRMGALAHEHSKLFTWQKVAERLIRASRLPGLDTSGLADFL